MPTALLQFDCGLWTTLTPRPASALRSAAPERIRLPRGGVGAGARERVFVEHARIAEAADRRGVAAVFGHVDMEARTERLVGLHTGGERPVAQREGRVQ